MYVGLLAALLMYCYKFYEELYHLFHKLNELNSETMMISVLTMVDVTMVANLIVMVVIGGYETFVSKLHVNEHADCPDWLEHINASTMKIKLAASLVTISGIHLLKAFINIDEQNMEHLKWMIFIHMVFLGSAVLLSLAERITPMSKHDH